MIGKSIKKRRTELGMSQVKLAQKLGVVKSAVSNYESNLSSPKGEILCKLFEVLECDANYLYQDLIPNISPQITTQEQTHIKKYRVCDERGKGMVDNVLEYEYNRTMALAKQNQEEELEPTITVKLSYNTAAAAAGTGSHLFEDYFEEVDFPVSVVPRDTDYAVKISGNSMEPTIPDGAIVFVRSCPAIDSGKIGLFSLDGEGYCKRLSVDYDCRKIWLVSDNPDCDDIEIHEDDYLHTFGEVLDWTEETQS